MKNIINTFEKEKSEIEQIRKEIVELTAPFYEKITKLQKIIDDCTHPASHIVEGEYVGGSDCDWDGHYATPPFRVCTICGYAEEGWGGGYWKLGRNNYKIKTINRKKAYEFVKKGILSQEKISDLRFRRQIP